jgi:plasmid stability protein
MKSLLLRGISEEELAALKRRAAAHHRSLQRELHTIVAEAVRSAPRPEKMKPIQLVMSTTTDDSPWVRESWYDDDGR